jgi:ubiquitin C-terminal hydrolase
MIIDDSNQTEVVNENKVINSEDFEYKLVGVVIHMGVADAGHYKSYINIARD